MVQTLASINIMFAVQQNLRNSLLARIFTRHETCKQKAACQRGDAVTIDVINTARFFNNDVIVSGTWVKSNSSVLKPYADNRFDYIVNLEFKLAKWKQ